MMKERWITERVVAPKDWLVTHAQSLSLGDRLAASFRIDDTDSYSSSRLGGSINRTGPLARKSIWEYLLLVPKYTIGAQRKHPEFKPIAAFWTQTSVLCSFCFELSFLLCVPCRSS